MNKYLCSIEHYFRGEETFVVEALDKNDAKIKASSSETLNKLSSPRDNYNKETIRVVKKIKSNKAG